ncbi:hypothetical protein [Paludisphaera sp.]|uniref:hypothetical protein n=1 Tax=Paludisphaera sp. TaxID=2017432 RepID=UPI00301DB638
MNILGHGVYGLSEAARLTGLRPARVREWFQGRKVGVRKPVFRGDYLPVDGDRAISFHDLIELFVAGQLRDRGVSLQNLRKVHQRLQADLGTSHPFCRREILTQGKQVFTLGLDDLGREEMIDVLSRQRVFPDVLRPFLERIDYSQATAMARRWCIADQVVVDPAISLGKPVVDPVGIATAVLAAAYEANDRDAELVADWYRINARHVLAAVEFERSLAA